MKNAIIAPVSLMMATMVSVQAPATFEDVPFGSGGIWQPPVEENFFCHIV